MKYYIKEMRPHHYIKNLLIFAPLLFSGQLIDFEKTLSCIWGFFAFCMISSAIYTINDILDVEKDRKHPTKCKRPIAAGYISIRRAWVMFFVLFASSILLNIPVWNFPSIGLIALYFFLNLAYSLGWKNIPILDVTILVSGFVIRVIYGAIISKIEISNWLYMTVIAFAFYLSLGKRRNELKKLNTGATRNVLKHYSEGFLDKNMYLCLGLANAFYALWAMDKTIYMEKPSLLIWSVPIVLLIFMKYSLNIEGDSDGDPVEVLIHDKALLFLCLVYALIIGWVLYI